jgi:hypothetical protein
MRRTSSSFRKEATREPFDLVLDEAERLPDGEYPVVTFLDPNRIESESSFDMARMNDAELMLRNLLSEDDFATFWSVWRKKPIEEMNGLIEDVMEHYGAERGKPRR